MAQLPAGMRNNNPGNIKYIGQPGTHPSVNTDQGDPQAVYATPEAGMAAMYQLLKRKYAGGKVTPAMIIAGQGGWTPNNMQAAQNIASYAGIDVNADIGLNDPVKAAKFMRALMLQEHGEASRAYTDAQISAAISGQGGAVAPTTTATTTAAPAVAAAPQAPYLGPNPYDDVLAEAMRRPRSRLADDLSSSVGRRAGGGQQAAAPVFETDDFSSPSVVDFASATPAPAAPMPRRQAAPATGGLAELFKVGEFGGAAKVDPVTGQPLLVRTRRT